MVASGRRREAGLPHIHIDYSSNLDQVHDMQSLVDALHAATLASGIAAASGVRTRALPRPHYRIADGDRAYGYVALTARLGPGREPHELRGYLEALVDVLEAELAPLADSHPLAISAELQFIDADYRINRNHIAGRRVEAGQAAPRREPL